MAVLLNVIAQTMNAGGSAIVTAFDAGSAAFNCTMSALSPGERSKLAVRIKEQEKKIHALSAGIAKESSKFADPAAALKSATVIGLLNAIKELHREIEPMKQRMAELDAIKGVKNPQEKPCGIPCMIVRSITGILPGEKAGLKRKIFANEKKIRQLYVDFAREVAKQPDPFEAINSPAVAAINAKINELNAEISAFKLQLADLDKPKPKPEKQKPAEKKPQPDAKKAPAESSGVAKFFIHAIAESVSGYLPGEKSGIERKLAGCDKKIQGLYLEVAKESVKYPDPADAITAAPVVALVTKINDLKAEVAALNQRKTELSPVKANAATPAKGAATQKPAAKPAAPVKTEAVIAEVPAETPVAVEAVEAAKDEPVAAEVPVEEPVAVEAVAPVKDEPVAAEVPVEEPVAVEAVAPVKDEPVAAEVPVEEPVAVEAVAPAKDEPTTAEVPAEAPVAVEAVASAMVEQVTEEIPVESPVSVVAVEAVDVDAGNAPAAPPEAESKSTAVMEAIAETSSGAERNKTKMPSPATGVNFEALSNISEFSGIDPVEGSTPYVFSRTKWLEVPVPVIPPPTEEDVKAVVHGITGEATSEEAVTSSDEPIAEPAVEEDLAMTTDVPAETVAEEADKGADVPAETVVEETDKVADVPAETVVEETDKVADVPAEAVAEETDKVADYISPATDVASLEHPPFIPVPEAEEVFRVHEAVTSKAAVAEEVPQESPLEAEAAETVVSGGVALAPQDELETSSESPVDAAEASPEEVPAPSAPVDADGVVADHPPIIPGLRPDSVVKEESGSGFRTRLFRNQFSILTPVPVETPVSEPTPPTREEIEAVASTLPADDVEKYKLNEILEGHEASSVTEKVAEPEAEKPEVEEPEELDATDHFKKLTARRKALLSGVNDDFATSGKGHSKKHKLTPED